MTNNEQISHIIEKWAVIKYLVELDDFDKLKDFLSLVEENNSLTNEERKIKRTAIKITKDLGSDPIYSFKGINLLQDIVDDEFYNYSESQKDDMLEKVFDEVEALRKNKRGLASKLDQGIVWG